MSWQAAAGGVVWRLLFYPHLSAASSNTSFPPSPPPVNWSAAQRDIGLATEMDLQCKLLEHLLDEPPWRGPEEGHFRLSESEERAKRGLSRDRDRTMRGRGKSRGRSRGRRKKGDSLHTIAFRSVAMTTDKIKKRASMIKVTKRQTPNGQAFVDVTRSCPASRRVPPPTPSISRAFVYVTRAVPLAWPRYQESFLLPQFGGIGRPAAVQRSPSRGSGNDGRRDDDSDHDGSGSDFSDFRCTKAKHCT